MSAVVSCNDVWKRYGKSARGIKELIVGRRKTTESKYSRDWALQDLSFEVPESSGFGIIGHNGTGKSTLLSLILGTIKPDRGEIRVRERLASLLELGAGFHPELTGRENIFLYGSILGMTLAEIRKNFDCIVEFSELNGAIDNPIRTYSNGMITRLGFSTIIHAPAEILLIDEVLAVGDSAFQDKCKTFLKDFLARRGTLVIVSHDMDALREMCSVGICLDRGKRVAEGSITDVIVQYQAISRANGDVPAP